MDAVIKAVFVGGGAGQPRLIRALRLPGARVDSVVAMADDGGSTGLPGNHGRAVAGRGDLRGGGVGVV